MRFAPRFILVMLLLASCTLALGAKTVRDIQNPPSPKPINAPSHNQYLLNDLAWSGQLNANPLADSIDPLPDPRYFEIQDRNWQLVFAEQRQNPAANPALEILLDRYEEFLVNAVVFSYVYADDDTQAQNFYDKLRGNFGPGRSQNGDGRYLKTLPDFVLYELRGDSDVALGPPGGILDSLITQSFTHGLANARPHVYDRFVSLARKVHALYMKNRYKSLDPADQDRMSLEPFDIMLIYSFESFMKSPRVNPYIRLRAWNHAPLELQQSAYDQIKLIFTQQSADFFHTPLDPVTFLPEPPGMPAWRASHK